MGIARRAGPRHRRDVAVYLDFIETLLAAGLSGARTLESLRIEFRREISRPVAAITAGLASSLDGGSFRIFNGDRTFVCGEVDLTPRPGR